MEQAISLINKIKAANKASVVFFGFIITSLMILAMIYLGAIYTNNKLEQEWGYVLSAYNQAIQESNKMNEEFVEELENKVDLIYNGNQEALEKDLKSVEEINDLTKALDSTVRGKYLMGIENDNNDPFIMNTEKILIDTSSNCAIPGAEGLSSVRTFYDEVYSAGGIGHFNPIIAQKALKSMATGENRTMIWSFLRVDESLPWFEEVQTMEYADLKTLNDLFFEYNGDIRVLQTFEFITPKYIYKNEDLAGNRTTNELRQPVENYRLIVVQGFNIVDVIDVLGYRTILDSAYNNVDNFMNVLKLTTVLILAVMFSLFFRISKEYNREISDRN